MRTDLPLMVDISNHQGFIGAGEALCWKDRLEALLVGCQRPIFARQQLRVLTELEVPVLGVYAFLYWNRDTTGQVQTALDVASSFPTIGPVVVLDCEDSPDADPNAWPALRIRELEECVRMVYAAGRRVPWIYAGGPFWRSAMANTSAFSHLPLIYPAYFNDERAIDSVDFGGWTAVEAHQFTSTPNEPFCGRSSLDINYWFGALPMIEDLNKRLKVVEGLVCSNGVYVDSEVPGAVQQPDGRWFISGQAALDYFANDGASAFEAIGQLQDKAHQHGPDLTVPGVARGI